MSSHQNFDFRLMRRGMKPYKMDELMLGAEMKEDMGKLAMEIFIDASNSGCSFQEAILSVYISGVHHGCHSNG